MSAASGFDGEDRFMTAPLRGRHVYLRQVGPEDYRLLRTAELSSDLGIRWRHRGASLSPEQWAQRLWHSVLAQHLVIGNDDPNPIGLVSAYQANFQDGYAYLAAERLQQRVSPLMVFGVALFVQYVFTCWDFHKLYLEVAEYNAGQFRSGRLFETEARLREHLWYRGRRWDQLILALYREAWMEEGGRLLTAAGPRPEVRAHVRMPPRSSEVTG
jgi:hypothetical protein